MELQRSADRARARGGLAAAAAFLERAARLTPEPARRAQRELTAAQAKHDAGAPDQALALLAAAEDVPLNELQRARLERLRAQLAFALRRGSDAPSLLLRAAQRLEPLDAGLARETYLEALAAAIFAARLSSGAGVLEVAEAARAAPRAPGPPRTVDLLLDGLATRFTDGYAAGVPPLRRRWLRYPKAMATARTTFVGFGCRAVSRPICGRTRRGMSWRPASFGSLAMPARSPFFRSRRPTAPASTCMPESLLPLRH